ncbi:hypothetical protein SAMCFNEI73_Ch0329 [Sinorhizobium americanum]|uniref:Uncharacterized protein n=1 Tax=Sinorhizobium americanum TaxID=194963 RepID=A0A1L3LHU3_9HYPH|nr:hypothetical protein SAMCFNEI73_Ch0329 [Sinorhizobium americanum]
MFPWLCARYRDSAAARKRLLIMCSHLRRKQVGPRLKATLYQQAATVPPMKNPPAAAWRFNPLELRRLSP